MSILAIMKTLTTIIVLCLSIILTGCSLSKTQTSDVVDVTIPTSTESVTPEPQVSQMTIYILGDSITAGYQLPIEESYPLVLQDMLSDAWYDVYVINAGESGDTSDGLIDRLDWIMADSSPADLAIVVIGGNDGLRWLSTVALQDNLTQIITTIQARDVRTIVWGMQIPTNLWPEYTTAFAQVYPDVAEATDSALIPFVLTGVGGVPELNLPDGIHPNMTWQIMVAQTVYDFLVENKLVGK